MSGYKKSKAFSRGGAEARRKRQKQSQECSREGAKARSKSWTKRIAFGGIGIAWWMRHAYPGLAALSATFEFAFARLLASATKGLLVRSAGNITRVGFADFCASFLRGKHFPLFPFAFFLRVFAPSREPVYAFGFSPGLQRRRAQAVRHGLGRPARAAGGFYFGKLAHHPAIQIMARPPGRRETTRSRPDHASACAPMLAKNFSNGLMRGAT